MAEQTTYPPGVYCQVLRQLEDVLHYHVSRSFGWGCLYASEEEPAFAAGLWLAHRLRLHT